VYASCLRHATARKHSFWCDPTAHEEGQHQQHLQQQQQHGGWKKDRHENDADDDGDGDVDSSGSSTRNVHTRKGSRMVVSDAAAATIAVPPPTTITATTSLPRTFMLPAPPKLLPPCLSKSHALLPKDSRSGMCDVQGRRKYIEDHFAIV
jgi:hypothetical protein